MLPPFIIEQIRRREQEERRRNEEREQPRLDIPAESYRPQPEVRHEEDEEPTRGVIILDLG